MMSNRGKERRCKGCGKLLLYEKWFCRRCVLEGCNKFVGGAAAAAGFVAAAVGLDALLNKSSGGNDDTTT